jgi:hypothetical protein
MGSVKSVLEECNIYIIFERRKNMNSKSINKRTIALVFLACFLIFSVLSGALLLTHTNHEHNSNGDYGSCTTCIQIQNIEKIFKQISTIAVGILFAIIGFFAVIAIIKEIMAYIVFSNPIVLKIRMDN